MRTRERRARLLALVLAASCASNPTPYKWRVSPEVAISSGKGAYALITRKDKLTVDGELIATTNATVAVLTPMGHLVAIPYDQVHELELGVHDTNEGWFAAWGVLGSFSTLTHGYFLVYTLPAWIVTSVAATWAETHRGLFTCEPSNARPRSRPVDADPEAPADSATLGELMFKSCLADAGAYARFPQGLPTGVGSAQLLGKAPVAPPAPRPVTTPDAGVAPDAEAAPEAGPPPAAPSDGGAWRAAALDG
jgi:hypothetical protein